MNYRALIKLLILAGLSPSPALADIRIHCHGQGPPVYLIGGGPAFTTWNLQPIQERLAAHYRVCRWDMRGVGDNSGLPLDPRVAALSQWLQDMQTVLPPEPVVLWGHSWGALQVLLFAKLYPDRVNKLILSNPVDPTLRSLEHIEQKRFNHPETDSIELEDVGTPVEERHNLRSKIASYFFDPAQGWEYAAAFTQNDVNSRLNIRIWDEYRNAPLTDADMWSLADKIGSAIFCRNDVLQPESLAEYRRLLSETEYHILADCAHFPWEENPEDYYRALRDLLGRI